MAALTCWSTGLLSLILVLEFVYLIFIFCFTKSLCLSHTQTLAVIKSFFSFYFKYCDHQEKSPQCVTIPNFLLKYVPFCIDH